MVKVSREAHGGSGGPATKDAGRREGLGAAKRVLRLEE